VVICLERDADLHMAQLMPLTLTVSCFSKIQIGFTFLVPAHPGSRGQRVVKRVCVCYFCCEKKMMTGCTNVWSMKYTVPNQKEDQRGPGDRLWKRTVKHAN